MTGPKFELVADIGRQARAHRTPPAGLPEGVAALDRIVRDMASAVAAVGPGMAAAVGRIMAAYDDALAAAAEAQIEADKREAIEHG